MTNADAACWEGGLLFGDGERGKKGEGGFCGKVPGASSSHLPGWGWHTCKARALQRGQEPGGARRGWTPGGGGPQAGIARLRGRWSGAPPARPPAAPQRSAAGSNCARGALHGAPGRLHRPPTCGFLAKKRGGLQHGGGEGSKSQMQRRGGCQGPPELLQCCQLQVKKILEI